MIAQAEPPAAESELRRDTQSLLDAIAQGQNGTPEQAAERLTKIGAEVSSAMLGEKVRAVLNTGAETCTACDNSCLMHIDGALHRQKTGVGTLHLAEILAANEGAR